MQATEQEDEYQMRNYFPVAKKDRPRSSVAYRMPIKEKKTPAIKLEKVRQGSLSNPQNLVVSITTPKTKKDILTSAQYALNRKLMISDL